MPNSPAFLPVPYTSSDWRSWGELMARAINNILAGGQNVITTITLGINTTTTELRDSRIGGTSYLSLSPITEAARVQDWWIGSIQKGLATIHHSASAGTRTYRVSIIA